MFSSAQRELLTSTNKYDRTVATQQFSKIDRMSLKFHQVRLVFSTCCRFLRCLSGTFTGCARPFASHSRSGVRYVVHYGFILRRTSCRVREMKFFGYRIRLSRTGMDVIALCAKKCTRGSRPVNVDTKHFCS